MALQVCAQADSATASSCLDEPEKAGTALARSRELWTPTRTDLGVTWTVPPRASRWSGGRLDAAEPFAVASMRRWEGGSQVNRTQSAIVLATIHVRAGEPAGCSWRTAQ